LSERLAEHEEHVVTGLGTSTLVAALSSFKVQRSKRMSDERKQQHQQGGQGGQQQPGGGAQEEGQELKPKPGRGREQHQFESPDYQPQPGHGSPDDTGAEDVPSHGT
jgi:hypothetical protein